MAGDDEDDSLRNGQLSARGSGGPGLAPLPRDPEGRADALRGSPSANMVVCLAGGPGGPRVTCPGDSPAAPGGDRALGPKGDPSATRHAPASGQLFTRTCPQPGRLLPGPAMGSQQKCSFTGGTRPLWARAPHSPPPLPCWFPSSRLTTGCARPPHKGGSPADQAGAGRLPGEPRHRWAAWGFPLPGHPWGPGFGSQPSYCPSQTHRDPHRPMARCDRRAGRDPGPEGPPPDRAPQSRLEAPPMRSLRSWGTTPDAVADPWSPAVIPKGARPGPLPVSRAGFPQAPVS